MLKNWWRKRKNIDDYAEFVGESNSEVDEIMELILGLPEKYKTTVHLYYYEGYNSREIAKILRKPESTIRTYLQKAKKRIPMAVITGDNKDIRKRQKNIKWDTWKVVVAACLTVVLVVPTGAYAATKLYQYFSNTVSTTNNSVNMKMSKSKKSQKKPECYIQLSADFGKNYVMDKTDYGELADTEEEDTMICYYYKGGCGKSFWYELAYMDCDRDEILLTYDNESYESITINGRKAVYCKHNNIVGSKYSSDHQNDYGQSIYIFIEEYGYVLQMAAQQGLEKKDF